MRNGGHGLLGRPHNRRYIKQGKCKGTGQQGVTKPEVDHENYHTEYPENHRGNGGQGICPEANQPRYPTLFRKLRHIDGGSHPYRQHDGYGEKGEVEGGHNHRPDASSGLYRLWFAENKNRGQSRWDTPEKDGPNNKGKDSYSAPGKAPDRPGCRFIVSGRSLFGLPDSLTQKDCYARVPRLLPQQS